MDLATGDENACKILLTPDSTGAMKVHDLKPFLDKYRQAPERRTGTAKMTELDSFIAHTIRFADADSAIFADDSTKTAPTLTTVLNYHRKGPTAPPRFGDHRAVYAFPVSDEWAAWSQGGGTWMLQGDFANFIENHIVDALDPAKAGDRALKFSAAIGADFASPSKLLELSRGLSIRVGHKMVNRVNRSSGETSFVFEAQNQDEAGAPLTVPGAFLIGIPVFMLGNPYQVAVRLRYKAKDGVISWSFDLVQPEIIFEHAFAEACAKATKETGLPLFRGKPE